jgi:hypothetical protein
MFQSCCGSCVSIGFGVATCCLQLCEPFTPRICAHIRDSHDNSVGAALVIAAVIKAPLDSDGHEPKATVHTLRPPVGGPDFELEIRYKGRIQHLVDQRQHHGRGMAIPMVLRRHGDVGDPARRGINPGRRMADDTSIGLSNQVDSVALFHLVEEHAM